MLQYSQITELILKSLNEETTQEEEAQLQRWADTDPEYSALLLRLKNREWLLGQLQQLELLQEEQAKEKVLAKWQKEQSKNSPPPVIETKKRLHFSWKVAIAAVVIGICSVFTYKMVNSPATKTVTPTVTRKMKMKIAVPGSDKAILHLADGSQHLIEDTEKGELAQLYNIAFSKERGSVICKTVAGGIEPPNEVRYNALETPKGGYYQLMLKDGSKIWLNSASRLQFPIVDTGNKRVVLLEGEAYFEVAATNVKPFIVKVNGADVGVTGTKFNIKAYPDGSIAKASLAEGHLNVFSGGSSVSVSPSQSASFIKGGKASVEQETNMYKVLAWKDKKFWWKGDSLTTALREVARWYNVTLQLDDMPASIVGIVVHDRSKPITEVLDILMTNTNFTYKIIEGVLHIRKRTQH